MLEFSVLGRYHRSLFRETLEDRRRYDGSRVIVTGIRVIRVVPNIYDDEP